MLSNIIHGLIGVAAMAFLIAFLIIGGPAQAGSLAAYAKGNLPPAHWQAKVRAKADTIAHLERDAKGLRRACGVRFDALGCVAGPKGMRVVYLWSGLRGQAKADVLMHESAHYLGWNHP